MMTSRFWIVLAITFAACATKQNPAATCTDNGMCSDPAFPYCDVDGSVAGQPGACIAVQCAASSFGTCDGSNALFCDATGEGYEPMPCANGCDPASGCITCTANSESCANNVDTRCDANGTLTMTTCSSGCATSGKGCSIPAPSNNLEIYFDMTATPIDLDLDDGTLNASAGTFTSSDGVTVTTVPVFQAPAPTGGVPINVVVAKSLTLGNITVVGAQAVAFLAIEAVSVTGTVTVGTTAFAPTGCTGGGGGANALGNQPYVTGGGGGGNGTPGAPGGSVTGTAAGTVSGGAGGASGGSQTLVPLVGGCEGGHSPAAIGGGGHGGGAIQLMSRTSISITGAIVVDGGSSQGSSGGGAGGGILVEAPTVAIADGAMLLARGAGGAAANTLPVAPTLDGSSPPGGVCTGPSEYCSDGGNGAPGNRAGLSIVLPANMGLPNPTTYSGGGGGGIGRIRVNTADGTFTPSGSAILVGIQTNGTMLTD
jgi:hypothetical protein